MSCSQLSFYYDIPLRVVTRICDNLNKAGLTNYVVLPNDKLGVAPAVETGSLSVGGLLSKLDHVGCHDFIPRFAIVYTGILTKIDAWLKQAYEALDNKLISDIDIPEDSDKEMAIIDTDKPFLKTDDI